jgi:MFS family permease
MPHARHLSLVLGFSQTLAWATTYYTPAVITDAAATTLGESPTILLGGFSWSLLIAALASPWVGRWIDRVGGRGVLATGTVAMALGLVLLAGFPSLAGWYIAWTIIGVGMALGLYDAAFATIGRHLGTGARPAIVGVTLMAGFASPIGWPMGVGLVQRFGWRITVLSYAVIQLAINLPLLLALIPKAVANAANPVPALIEQGAPSRGILAFVLLATFFSVRAVISAVISVHVLLLRQGIGLTAAVAVGAAAMIGPSQVGGRVLEWGLARHIDPLTGSLIGAGLLRLGVVGLDAGGLAIGFAVAYGMSNGILTISRGTLPMHLFGARGYATRLGKLALPPLLAQAMAPTLVTPFVLSHSAAYVFVWVGNTSGVALLCLLPLRVLVPVPDASFNGREGSG